jgi:hypothetical protein
VPIVLRTIAPEQNPAATLTDRSESRLEQFLEVWSATGRDRDAALLVAMSILCGGIAPQQTIWGCYPNMHVDPGWELDEAEQHAVVTEFLAQGADFHRVLKSGWPTQLLDAWKATFDGEDSPGFAATRRLLLNSGAIRLDRIIDIERLRQNGATGRWGVAPGARATNGALYWDDGVAWSDPWALRVWLTYDGTDALEALLGEFTAEPLSELPALATGILSEVLSMFGRFGREHHFLSFEKADAGLRAAIRPYCKHLRALLNQSATKDQPAIRELWLVYFRLAYDGDPRQCPPEVRKQALDLASEDLARMRKIFRAATASGATPEAAAFVNAQRHFDNICIVLARHGSIWTCLKPLLLGLRALNTPSVATDLRFWVEPHLPPPPTPWSHLPQLMAVVVHEFAGHEQECDRDLVSLREQFASFCAERLKDCLPDAERMKARAREARTDKDMFEKVAAWRYCYVRALADLRANPEGRAHRTLFWSSKHDPDSTVRQAAEHAYNVVRHSRGLPERVSPRRAVMSALWWLRQAHLLGLGIQPDRDLAQRTREKELTRTKEAEKDAAASNNN